VAAVVAALNHGRLGGLLRALADSPAGVGFCGASINVTRVLVFCLSASLAAVAGVLDGGTLGIVGGDGYQPILSLQLFALILPTAGDVPWYALLAAFGQILAPAYISTSPTVGYALTLAFGLSAILYCVTPESSRQLPPAIRRLIDRLGPRAQPAEPTQRTTEALVPESHRDGELKVDSVTVRFGGLVAADALALCGLVSLADESVGTLSTGQRRLVELARCVAGPFHLMLLDEPSSGLDRVETERFGEIVAGIVREHGVGVLLIEHDMSLVNRLCDHIYVLDFGKLIFQGTASEVGASAVVRAAYLGDESAADAGSALAQLSEEAGQA
jgi:ABC transporter family protein/branched-subunit amino acid transport system permease